MYQVPVFFVFLKPTLRKRLVFVCPLCVVVFFELGKFLFFSVFLIYLSKEKKKKWGGRDLDISDPIERK